MSGFPRSRGKCPKDKVGSSDIGRRQYPSTRGREPKGGAGWPGFPRSRGKCPKDKGGSSDVGRRQYPSTRGREPKGWARCRVSPVHGGNVRRTKGATGRGRSATRQNHRKTAQTKTLEVEWPSPFETKGDASKPQKRTTTARRGMRAGTQGMTDSPSALRPPLTSHLPNLQPRTLRLWSAPLSRSAGPLQKTRVSPAKKYEIQGGNVRAWPVPRYGGQSGITGR